MGTEGNNEEEARQEHPPHGHIGQISQRRDAYIQPLQLLVGSVHLGSSWAEEDLIDVVGASEEHDAKDVDDNMQPATDIKHLAVVVPGDADDGCFTTQLPRLERDEDETHNGCREDEKHEQDIQRHPASPPRHQPPLTPPRHALFAITHHVLQVIDRRRGPRLVLIQLLPGAVKLRRAGLMLARVMPESRVQRPLSASLPGERLGRLAPDEVDNVIGDQAVQTHDAGHGPAEPGKGATPLKRGKGRKRVAQVDGGL